mgnify:FL=1
MSWVLPYNMFFTPNSKFFEVLKEHYNDAPILEAGCGVGNTVAKMKAHGKDHDLAFLKNARGFDLHERERYDIDMGCFFIADAMDCMYYHKGLQVMVCRPDHGGWVSLVLEDFLENKDRKSVV